jgi:fructokinase
MTKQSLMVGLGEVLWDFLPSGKLLGGAPTNFAYMACVLGDWGVVASRVGKDNLGQEACDQLEKLGLNTKYLQADSQSRTGTAGVTIDSAGQPTFTIDESVAWDGLQWTPEWQELAARADVICFGSLAQRSPVSADTIDRFLNNCKSDALRIFDVNLRQCYYEKEVLERSLHHANIVKLSEQELSVVGAMLGLQGNSAKLLARQLRQKYELELVGVTRGARGSLLVSEHECVCHPGFAVNVVDSVGAGDAFTACLAHHYVRGHSLSEISGYANRFASWIATQVGATPAINPPQVQELLRGAGAARGCANGLHPDVGKSECCTGEETISPVSAPS